MFISDILEHRHSATYKVLGESPGDSRPHKANQGDQKHYKVLHNGLVHRGPATHSMSPCISSAHVAVPKRLGA
jgi:hypothetical protein